MCVYSMVMDHYQPLIDPWIVPMTRPWEAPPERGRGTPSVDLTELLKVGQLEELRKLIAEFKEAVEAAKKVDVLTKQPDCEDPEKVKLVERVAQLEKRLDELTRAKSKTKRPPAKPPRHGRASDAGHDGYTG